MDRGDKVSDTRPYADTDAQLATRILFWEGNGPGPEARAELERRYPNGFPDTLERMAEGES